MIESIEFTNFKALRKTTLPLAPFTLLLGPNGSGKTSVLQALSAISAYTASKLGVRQPSEASLVWQSLLSVTAPQGSNSVEAKLHLLLNKNRIVATYQWHSNGQIGVTYNGESGKAVNQPTAVLAEQWVSRMQVYALNSSAIAQPVAVNARPLQPTGAGLAAVLDDVKDNHPERWESLLAEMRQWLPEYDHIQFNKPGSGQKSIVLRTAKGKHRIPAEELSQGTLIALALLTLAYLPDPPTLIALEEIDHSLHPRLLRHLQDALYRLSYPESCGESRAPIQVIATTHSPYLLDLYREHPNEVVLAEKKGLEVEMKRLTDIEHFEDILGESPLSEVWYSGVLGGVAVKP